MTGLFCRRESDKRCHERHWFASCDKQGRIMFHNRLGREKELDNTGFAPFAATGRFPSVELLAIRCRCQNFRWEGIRIRWPARTSERSELVESPHQIAIASARHRTYSV